MVAALEKHTRSLKADEATPRAMEGAGTRAPRRPSWTVRYRRLEAELWLNEEKAR